MNTVAAKQARPVGSVEIAATIYAAIERNIRAMTKRANQRRALAGLNDRMLADMGLTRADVEREIRKPVWQK